MPRPNRAHSLQSAAETRKIVKTGKLPFKNGCKKGKASSPNAPIMVMNAAIFMEMEASSRAVQFASHCTRNLAENINWAKTPSPSHILLMILVHKIIVLNSIGYIYI